MDTTSNHPKCSAELSAVANRGDSRRAKPTAAFKLGAVALIVGIWAVGAISPTNALSASAGRTPSPTVERSTFGTRSGGNYVSFKSDGYVCGSSVCNLYAGRLFDSSGTERAWRGAFFAPYAMLKNGDVYLLRARLHLTQLTSVRFWTGNPSPHSYTIGNATCLNSFDCVDRWWSSGVVGTSGDIDATAAYRAMAANSDFGAWMVIGADTEAASWKNFDPGKSFVEFSYTRRPAAATLNSPSDGATIETLSPYLKADAATDPDGNPVKYRFVISTGPQPSADVVIRSDWLDNPNWDVPAGALTDGKTYYWSVQTWDTQSGDPSAASPGSSTGSVASSFKTDLAQGTGGTRPTLAELPTGTKTVSKKSGKWVMRSDLMFKPGGRGQGLNELSTVEVAIDKRGRPRSEKPIDGAPWPSLTPSSATGTLAWNTGGSVSRAFQSRPVWIRVGDKGGRWSQWARLQP